MRNDAGEQMYGIAQMPVDICVADSQGGIGYMIERMMKNVLEKHGVSKNIVTLVTQVTVDKVDPAFKDPQKRIGKIYSKSEADKLVKEKGWIFKEEIKQKDGWRRVVPSPKPTDIMNANIIRELCLGGNIVIAAGGGGVPVYYDEHGFVKPAEAVIDKDMASSLLASKIGADEFYILTDVPFVYLNYSKPDQEVREFLNLTDARKYLEDGQFSKGSMAPKILACIRFIDSGGSKSVITEAFHLQNRDFGTKITREYDPADLEKARNRKYQ
jgi:carbamate kinase